MYPLAESGSQAVSALRAGGGSAVSVGSDGRSTGKSCKLKAPFRTPMGCGLEPVFQSIFFLLFWNTFIFLSLIKKIEIGTNEKIKIACYSRVWYLS